MYSYAMGHAREYGVNFAPLPELQRLRREAHPARPLKPFPVTEDPHYYEYEADPLTFSSQCQYNLLWLSGQDLDEYRELGYDFPDDPDAFELWFENNGFILPCPILSDPDPAHFPATIVAPLGVSLTERISLASVRHV